MDKAIVDHNKRVKSIAKKFVDDLDLPDALASGQVIVYYQSKGVYQVDVVHSPKRITFR